jgi:hypothetical protein
VELKPRNLKKNPRKGGEEEDGGGGMIEPDWADITGDVITDLDQEGKNKKNLNKDD